MNEERGNCFSFRYNDCWYVGNQAVEDIHNRACYDGYADVMLVTNAIRNSSSSGLSGMTELLIIFLYRMTRPVDASAVLAQLILTFVFVTLVFQVNPAKVPWV